MSPSARRGPTRRQCLRTLAAASGLLQSGCLLDVDDETPGLAGSIPGLYVLFFFWGQRGSELYLRAIRIREEERERRKAEAEKARKAREELEDKYPEFFQPPYDPLDPAMSPVGGVAAGSASGPAPGGSSSLRAPAQTVDAERAYYLLDTLGDDQVDGRVYAFRIQGEQISLRGQVGLRPTDSSLPSIGLRHIALSPDGAQLVVSQSGAPSQWIFIDALSLAISGRIPAPEGEIARRALFSPDGRSVYLIGGTNSSLRPPATLHIADAASRSLIGQVELPSTVSFDDVAATPDGGLLLGAGGLYLHSIDVRTGSYGGRLLVSRPASDPAGPRSGNFQRLVLDPGGGLVYTAGLQYQADNHYAIGVHDVRSLDVVGEIPVAARPEVGRPLLEMSPSGRTLAYAPQLGAAVQLFDVRTGVEIASVPLDADFRLTELGPV
ncbi:MAG: hypothetical protein GC160_21755 [Acidobacteria bacterium]|nr:hypothetical protein [Acidobacteriota bacterium]